MRSPSNSPQPSTVPPLSHQYLVPPFDRIRFTALFVLATGIGWLLIWLVLHSVQDPLNPTYLEERGLFGVFIVGLVAGIVVSATQWLVLRRYLPDWLWILAGAAGYVLLTVTLEAWWQWFGQALAIPAVANQVNRLPAIAIPAISGILRTFMAAFCAIWLGLTQWLLLRQYTQASGWWIAVPSIAVLVSSVFAALNIALPSFGVNLPLANSVLGAGILGTTQAIGLCALQRKNLFPLLGDRNSPLVSAPEIFNYPQIQSLAKLLHRRLNMTWISEHLNEESLAYLVGVTQNGAIAAYKPINQPAIEQVHQIPLPELLEADRPKWTQTPTEPLARFEVTFLPSGSLQVNPWRGFPLPWIALAMLAIVVVFSAIVARLGGLIPFLR